MLRWTLTRRRRIVAVAVILLLALDLGRSIYARAGYRTPATAWDGGAYDTDYPWPPGAQVSAKAGAGERLYVQYCSMCHGLEGNSFGAAAGNMTPMPRDFSSGEFKYKSTLASAPPSDADLIEVVSSGLQGSAMPYFSDGCA